MEITKSQIARLVLGYLKSENCINAFNEFLIKSQYLKSHAVFVKNGKYFATRVGGNTLEDIIAEYSEVALIIQGRLEQTNYYDKDLRMKLPEQLFYILDNISRSSTPILPDNLNTTPIESLPGNSTNISHNPSDKTKVNSKDKTAETEKGTSTECQNTIQISPGSSQKGEKRSSLAELDNKITSIKKQAEKDPAFDKLLEEIIGDETDASSLVSITKSQLNKNQSSVIEISDNDLNKKDSNELFNKKTCDTSRSDVKKLNSNPSDLYISKPATISPQQNQFYLTNTQGLLMVPSLMNPPNYIFLNSGPTSTASLNNIVTETELMKMPTVIIEDSASNQQPILTVPQPQMAIQQSQILNNQHPIMVNSSQLIMTSKPTPVTSQKPIMSKITSLNTMNTNNKSVKKIKTIAPRTEKITLSTADGNFYQVFDENSDNVVLSIKAPETTTFCNNLELDKLKQPISNTVVLSPPKKEKSPSSPIKISNNFKTSPKSEKRKKTAKSLFKDSKKGQKENVWDADLRKLLEASPISGEQQDIGGGRISPSDTTFELSDDRLDVSCDDEELKKGALMIESAFKTPVKIQHIEEKQKVEHAKEISIDEKETVTTCSPKEKSEPSELIEPCSLKPEDLGNEEEKVITEETEVYLRNCNGPSRIKKKCNPTKTSSVVVKIVEENSFTEEKTVNKIPSLKEYESRMERDIILQTPVKGNFPKTPGKFEITPFTKAIEEQLLGMDLLSLPTPNITTPSFPITPNINLNTPEQHSNRPTDYSTSSSYYQPSDPEQNKSLEIMMEEYRRQEREKEIPIKIEENAITSKETDVSPGPVLSEIKKTFNKSVIGKKNLNLIKEKNYPCSEDAENSDSSNSNSSSSESSSSSDSDSDAFHTPKKATSSSRESYCFRKRITPTSIVINDESHKKSKSSLIRTPNEEMESIQQENTERKENTLKRNSMNTLITTRRRNPPRSKSGKFCKIKTEPKMSPKGDEQLLVEKCDYENEITDDDFALHLSTDEDSTNKITNDVGAHKNKEENTTISPQQAQQPPCEKAKQLIKDLYDRGIHLLPKVSPKKPSDSSLEVEKKTNFEPEINLNALENLDVSSEDNCSMNNMEEASDSFPIHNRANIAFGIKENYCSNVVVSSSKKRKKQGGDFNLSGKKLSVELFMETLDTTKEVIIEILPVDTIIDIVPKKNTSRNRKYSKPESKPKVSKTANKKQLESKTNSEIHHNCTEKIEKNQGSSSKEIKKNDDSKPESKPLISKVNTTANKKLTEPKTNSENAPKSTEKIEKNRGSSSKESKKNDDNKNEKTENVVSASPKKSNLKKLKRSYSTDDRNKEKNKNNKNSSNKISEIILEKWKSVEESVVERLQNDKEELPSMECGEDDLMNFAVTGNSTEQEKEVELKRGEKRKLSSEGENRLPEKKPKSGNEEKQDLLQMINVDLFLNQVHGSAEPS